MMVLHCTDIALTPVLPSGLSVVAERMYKHVVGEELRDWLVISWRHQAVVLSKILSALGELVDHIFRTTDRYFVADVEAAFICDGQDIIAASVLPSK
jgi:hypothetical protein